MTLFLSQTPFPPFFLGNMSSSDCSKPPLPDIPLQSRRYPRPRIPCPDCKQELVLRWGDFRKLHLAHLPGSRGNCPGTGESAKHQLAKQVLCEHLNAGGEVLVARTCSQCEHRTTTLSVKLSDLQQEVAREEIPLENGGRADVALMSTITGNILAVLEVLVGHATSESQRDGSWFELDANEILDAWDRKNDQQQQQDPKPWKLTEQRETLCGCPSLFDFARDLGYVYPDFRSNCHDFERKLRKASLNDPKIKWHWATESQNWGPQGVWDAFSRRSRCLKCEKSHQTSKGKPYCFSCWRLIRDEEDEVCIERKLEVSPDEKRALRSELRWLDAVPSAAQTPCVGCSEPGFSPVFFFGKKSICFPCAAKADEDPSFRARVTKIGVETPRGPQYNAFLKKEIPRVKEAQPNLVHKEAFKLAVVSVSPTFSLSEALYVSLVLTSFLFFLCSSQWRAANENPESK